MTAHHGSSRGGENWSNVRFEPDQPLAPSIRDLPLEGLRGFAALMVLYTHVSVPLPRLDPVYAPSPIWWRVQVGVGAVMLFFVLSGCVMGLGNRQAATYYLRDVPWLPSGTVQSYALRLVLTLMVVGVCAWLAEARLQPLIVSRVRRTP
jgi:peptidoglycan/LPS O-acetylase OafA/YrhL